MNLHSTGLSGPSVVTPQCRALVAQICLARAIWGVEVMVIVSSYSQLDSSERKVFQMGPPVGKVACFLLWSGAAASDIDVLGTQYEVGPL